MRLEAWQSSYLTTKPFGVLPSSKHSRAWGQTTRQLELDWSCRKCPLLDSLPQAMLYDIALVSRKPWQQRPWRCKDDQEEDAVATSTRPRPPGKSPSFPKLPRAEALRRHDPHLPDRSLRSYSQRHPGPAWWDRQGCWSLGSLKRFLAWAQRSFHQFSLSWVGNTYHHC